MAVTLNDKILSTEAGYQNVSRLEGDTLTGTVLQNKQQFDVYPNLIKDHFNNLVDKLVVDLGNKVDKVPNKGLSKNDYTDADKEIVNSVPSLASSVASQGTSISNLQTTVGNKVDKVTGKGLSTNDYTTNEKNKLSGIASGAEVNVQADWNETNTNSDAYIKNKPTIADTVSAGTGLTKNGNTINHSNSVTAGTIGSTNATSGSSIAIPYATYDAQGHIKTKGTRTHTVTVDPSAVGISYGTSGVGASDWTWIRLGDYAICWKREQGAIFNDGYTTISYPFRFKSSTTTAVERPIVLTSFLYDPNGLLSSGVTLTTQPSASSTVIYARNSAGTVNGTYNVGVVVIGKVSE